MATVAPNLACRWQPPFRSIENNTPPDQEERDEIRESKGQFKRWEYEDSMGRYEIRVTINAPLKTVFDVYSQLDTWSWSDIRRLTWTHGKPWELDSRMEFEPKESFGATVDQVIVHFERYRRVDFISQFGGVTLLSQIHFESLLEDVTEISSKLEFIGTFSRMAGVAIGTTIENGARKFYESLKRACETEPHDKVR